MMPPAAAAAQDHAQAGAEVGILGIQPRRPVLHHCLARSVTGGGGTGQSLAGATAAVRRGTGPASCGSGFTRFTRIPPRVSRAAGRVRAQIKGFTLYATRTILSGGGEELLELTKTNLRELEVE